MTESESFTSGTSVTGDSGFNDGSSSVPLMLTSAYQDDQQRNKTEMLPHVMLPSHRYRYTVWHELSKTYIKGSELKAPRVREGPPEKEDLFYRMSDEGQKSIHHTRQGRERKDHRDTAENWEAAVVCNLSYQDHQHPYQRHNFIRVLKRLVIVEELNLVSNGLTDVSPVTFPKCVHLNLSRNHLKSFYKLPHIPKIKELVLAQNYIKTLDGLERLGKTPIVSLTLKENPVAFTLNYRQKIFAKLPQLKTLDGLPRLPSDGDFVPYRGRQVSDGAAETDKDNEPSKFCRVS